MYNSTIDELKNYGNASFIFVKNECQFLVMWFCICVGVFFQGCLHGLLNINGDTSRSTINLVARHGTSFNGPLTNNYQGL